MTHLKPDLYMSAQQGSDVSYTGRVGSSSAALLLIVPSYVCSSDVAMEQLRYIVHELDLINGEHQWFLQTKDKQRSS